MKQTRLIMGMPITVEIVEKADATATESPAVPASATATTIEKVFDYFHYIDEKFSTYKENSEIMRINRGEILLENSSDDMREIFDLAERTRNETGGYFDIVNRSGIFDPSGIVKGWTILKASRIIESVGFKDYFVEAGGDIQVGGYNRQGELWRVGVRNPFVTEKKEIVKIVLLGGGRMNGSDNGNWVNGSKNGNGMNGIATSGTYLRGQHIYNPKDRDSAISDIASLSVIGPNVYEADRFATAAFAMGKKGIDFIEQQKGLEGYIIDSAGIATMTSGFEALTALTALTAISDIAKK
jgi:thiamine biosynthesis lipoprotein